MATLGAPFRGRLSVMALGRVRLDLFMKGSVHCLAASIFGLFLRFLAHRKEQAGIEYATREAEKDSQGQ